MSFLDNVGPYWQRSNAEFEATNPNILQKTWRGFNPLTATGSAIGDAYSSAQRGDKLGMFLATVDAMPLFGSMVSVPARGLMKASSRAGLSSKSMIQGLALNDANDSHQTDQQKRQIFSYSK